MKQGFYHSSSASDPKLEASDRLNLPVIRAMEIPFSSPDMGMAHQRLDRFEIVSLIQEGCGKGVPHLRKYI